MAVLFLFVVLAAAGVDCQFVCYHLPSCGDGVSRPVFVLGGSLEDCCGQPDVVSAKRDIAGEGCSQCGPPSLEYVTPRYSALAPPDTLALEVQATRYTAITWIRNGTAMHDFQRLELDDFSKRFILNDTSEADYGRYEADMHAIGGGVLTVEFFVEEYAAPVVTVNQTSEGDYLNLTCTTVGNPLPSVTWQQGNRTLPPNTTLTSTTPPPSTTIILEIYNGVPGEEYTCVATNSHAGGSRTVSESIIILPEPPEVILVNPLALEPMVTVPAAIDLTCVSRGRPAPAISWLRDDVPLVEEEGGKVEVTVRTIAETTVSQLRVDPSAYEDRGNYSCIATNVAGEDSYIFQLILQVPPDVTVWPEKEEVNIHDVGHMVVFMCRAFGFPPPQVIWVSGTGGVLNGYCEGPALAEVFGEAPAALDYGDFYDRPMDAGGVDYMQGGSGDPMDIGGESPEEVVMPTRNETMLVEELRPSDCNVSLMVADRNSTTVSVLTINSAHMEQSANFTCYAKNRIGSTQNASVELVIIASPFFLSRPSPTLHPILSLYVELNCTVAGQIPLEVVWVKDGDIFSQGSRVNIELSNRGSIVSSVLRIVSVEEEDAGVYTCRTKDNNGTSSTSTTIDVRVPANITSPPVTTQADLFSNSSFTCQARGHPLPAIYWSKFSGNDTLSLDDFTTETSSANTSVVRIVQVETDVRTGVVTSQLVIENVQREDRGVYVCHTSNSVILSNLTTVRDSATAELIVEVPPSFTSVPPSLTTVTSPTSVFFTCTAQGLPRPDLSWYFDGIQLTNTSNHVITTSTMPGRELSLHSSLLVVSTGPRNAGQYACIAENGAGRNSTTFQLAVQTPPTVTITPTLISTTFPNGSATFECVAMGSPLPNVTWYHGTQELTSVCGDPFGCYGEYTYEADIELQSSHCDFFCRSSFPLSTSVTITITNPAVRDAGQYICRGDNGAGDPGNDTATLDVEVIPRVLVRHAHPTRLVREGETFSLVCEAYGLPTPEVTWLQMGSPVSITFADNPRHMTQTVAVEEFFVQSILNISDVVPGLDEGEYRCRVDNFNITNQQVTASINISILARNECVLNEEGTPCQNGGVCLDEVGGYSCICTGNFTGVNCSEEALSPSRPVIVANPVNQEVDFFQPVNLTCSATGEPEPVYSWFRDGELVTVTLDSVYAIPEARPIHRGKYTCIASNTHGSTNSSSPGLLTITGVFQYLANFTSCQDSASENFEDLLNKMTDCISGNILQTTQAEIYSVTSRPVRVGPSPEDQVVVTLLTNSSSTSSIVEDLKTELQVVTEKFGCQFNSVVRFDGCPVERRDLSVEYNVSVPWRETEITEEVMVECPCGSLNSSIHGGRTLLRRCGGSYTYGAEWGDVTDDCTFSSTTFQLCNITTLAEISQQAGALAEATGDSPSFSSLDFTIAAAIMRIFADSALATTGTEFQMNFTRSFDNLLATEAASIAESQELFQAPSGLLDTLSKFAGQVTIGTEAISFTENRFQLQIEERSTATFTNQSYSPELSTQEEEFQEDFEGKPLMDASITLPRALVEQLNMQGSVDKTLRLINYALLTDSLFVVEENSELGQILANGTMIVGNVIIAASVAGEGRVEGLTEPVVIRFTQTKGLNMSNMTEARCVFWEPPNDKFGTWSSEGCDLVAVTEGEIECHCNHLTHFGLLLAINPLPPDDQVVSLTLEIITYVALTLSILCLLITIVTYLATKKLRTRVFGQMLLHMCFSLLGLYATFLVSQQGASYSGILWFCFASSAVLQYFMLAYFLWTAVEAVHLYLKLVKVFGSDVRHYVLWASLIAWGIPVVIVAVSAGTGIYFDTNDESSNLFAVRHMGEVFFCRPESWPFYFGVILPFVLIYLFNWTIFAIIMFSMGRRLIRKQKTAEVKGEKHTKEYKQLIVIALCLSVMFGLGWVFGLLVPIPNRDFSIVAQYLFAIFIGIHGVFIFFFHCLRSNDVRKEWQRWFYVVCCCKRKPDNLLSTITPHVTHGTPKQRRHEYLGFAGDTKPVQRKNPIYESQDNLLFSDTDTMPTFVSPYDMTTPRKEKLKDDSGVLNKAQSLESIGGLSYDSQTVHIDFHTAETSDEEEDLTLDLKDLTAIVNTNFQFPTGDGFAASDFIVPSYPSSPPPTTSPSSPEAPLPMHTTTSLDSPLPTHTIASESDDTTAM